jgi:hypothetical protein
MTTKTKSNKTSHAKANTKANNNKKNVPVKKHHEHGVLLTGALILMGLHGIVAAAAYASMNHAPDTQKPWLISLMVLHCLMNIVAAAGIYEWKKWGLYVYAVSTVIALVVGLMSAGIWSAFYMVLPLVIVGWLLRTKWANFE